MKQLSFIYIILFSFFSSYSQIEADLQLPVEEKKDKLKFVFNFDARRSFIIGHNVKFWGIKIGLGNKKHRFGLGFHGTQEPVVRTKSGPDFLDATDTTFANYGHSSFYYERILFQSKRWELSAPVHLNFGKLEGFYRDTAGNNILFYEQGTTSVTLSFKGHYKVWRWFGLGAGLGYNQILAGDRNIKKSLSSPFYSYGVKIFIGELWKLTFNKEYRKTDWVD